MPKGRLAIVAAVAIFRESQIAVHSVGERSANHQLLRSGFSKAGRRSLRQYIETLPCKDLGCRLRSQIAEEISRIWIGRSLDKGNRIDDWAMARSWKCANQFHL